MSNNIVLGEAGPRSRKTTKRKQTPSSTIQPRKSSTVDVSSVSSDLSRGQSAGGSGNSSSSSSSSASSCSDDKRPRTAFNADQLAVLRREFDADRYLTEDRRRRLADELGLHESQIKIWFQNKRAKLKKASGLPNQLAIELAAQGLYNHSTVSKSDCGSPTS